MLLLLTLLTLADVSSSTGVNIHFTGAPSRDLDLIRDGGFGWIRMDFVWSSVEREKGVYRFRPYDELLEGLTSRGIRALFILDYSNRLYEKDRSVRTQEGREAFARFAAAAAGRYRGRGIRWEIWNEPNLEGFWKPQPAVEDYAALVIETARAIRAADPQARILAPASSGFPWSFLEGIFQKGILEHIDEVSVHPYRSSPPETVREDYDRLRKLIVKYASGGRPVPPVISGEWGYSTWHHGGKPFSAEVQGMYLAREFLTNMAEGIPLSIWYDWANDGPDPKETEHNFGTVTLDRKPKPAYLAAKTLHSILRNARFERPFRAGPEDHILLFRKENRGILSLWTRGGEHLVILQTPGLDGEVKHTLWTGGTSGWVVARKGIIDQKLSGAPLYLELPAGAADSLSVCGLESTPGEEGLRILARRSGRGSSRVKLEVKAWEVDSPTEIEGKENRKDLIHLNRELSLKGDEETTVEIPLKWPLLRPAHVQASLRDPETGNVLALLASGRSLLYRNLDLFSTEGKKGSPEFLHLSAVMDGDAKVEGEAKLSTVSLAGEEGAPASRAVRLEYRFGRGWKFVRLVPKERLPIARGKLSIWIRGDGSGNSLRCRFRDSRGETFQPTAGPVNWTGWKRVEIPLDESQAGSWGGDGAVDDPIQWDSLLLLDSTRRGGEGIIEFASPILILPAPPF